jgi:hypothetical protein
VCAGRKTELQVGDEQNEARVASERRAEQSRAMMHEVGKELWEPRIALMKSNQIQSRGAALDPYWKLVLIGIGSLLPDVDPLNVLFGPVHPAINHVVQQLKDNEIHVIRWHPDPNQYLQHLFEVFPHSGARLDLEKKRLFVAAERKLFPDPYRSLTFCHLASSLLGSGLPRDGRFRFQPANP